MQELLCTHIIQKNGDFEENSDEAVNYFGDAYDICDLIYDITESDNCNNAYSLQLWKNLSEALELAESIYWKADICWRLWLVYEKLEMIEESQCYLKKAYNYVISDQYLHRSVGV